MNQWDEGKTQKTGFPWSLWTQLLVAHPFTFLCRCCWCKLWHHFRHSVPAGEEWNRWVRLVPLHKQPKLQIRRVHTIKLISKNSDIWQRSVEVSHDKKRLEGGHFVWIYCNRKLNDLKHTRTLLAEHLRSPAEKHGNDEGGRSGARSDRVWKKMRSKGKDSSDVFFMGRTQDVHKGSPEIVEAAYFLQTYISIKI